MQLNVLVIVMSWSWLHDVIVKFYYLLVIEITYYWLLLFFKTYDSDDYAQDWLLLDTSMIIYSFVRSWLVPIDYHCLFSSLIPNYRL